MVSFFKFGLLALASEWQLLTVICPLFLSVKFEIIFSVKFEIGYLQFKFSRSQLQIVHLNSSANQLYELIIHFIFTWRMKFILQRKSKQIMTLTILKVKPFITLWLNALPLFWWIEILQTDIGLQMNLPLARGFSDKFGHSAFRAR